MLPSLCHFQILYPLNIFVLVFFIYYRRSSQLEAPRPCISELNYHDEEIVLLWIELLVTSILIKLPDDQDRKKFQLENKTNYNSSAVLHIKEMMRTLALTLGFQDKALVWFGKSLQRYASHFKAPSNRIWNRTKTHHGAPCYSIRINNYSYNGSEASRI